MPRCSRTWTFTTAQKTAWFTKLYAVTPPADSNAAARMPCFASANISGPECHSRPGRRKPTPLDPATGQRQMNFHLGWQPTATELPLSAGKRRRHRTQTVPEPRPAPSQGFNAGKPVSIRPLFRGGPSPAPTSLAGSGDEILDHRSCAPCPTECPPRLPPWQHLTLYGVSDRPSQRRGNICPLASIDDHQSRATRPRLPPIPPRPAKLTGR